MSFCKHFTKILVIFLAVFLSSCNSSKTKLKETVQTIDFRDSFDYFSLDPLYKKSWHLYEMYPKSDISLQKTWQEGYTGKNIKIAVIDNGFNIHHEELANSFIYAINSDTKESVNYIENDDHGTSVAGIIGARSNGLGGLGIAPSAKLILVQTSLKTVSLMVESLNTAAQQNPDIINCSWGTNHVSDALKEQLEILSTKGRNGKGTIIVFATGNNNKDQDEAFVEDESELPSVIGVGAITPKNEKADFSNYGSNMDLVAPGVNILVPHQNTYAQATGTSFAAPMVSGAVALMLSKNPNLTKTQVEDILKKTADKLTNMPQVSTKIQKCLGTETSVIYKNGFNKCYGYGKINVDKALAEIPK